MSIATVRQRIHARVPAKRAWFFAAAAAMSIAAVVPGSLALAPTGASAATNMQAPAVPSNLQVPAGNVPYLRYHAVGTQNYVCLPVSASDPFDYRWTFQGPQATLFHPRTGLPAGTHYLSAITPPDSGGMPTWQDNSGDKVWATKLAASTDPAFVDPTAIPWLLLKTVFFDGLGPVSGASYIQRINTVGGLGEGQLTNTQPPPETTTCATGADVGKVSFEPYQADYIFYKSIN